MIDQGWTERCLRNKRGGLGKFGGCGLSFAIRCIRPSQSLPGNVEDTIAVAIALI